MTKNWSEKSVLINNSLVGKISKELQCNITNICPI